MPHKRELAFHSYQPFLIVYQPTNLLPSRLDAEASWVSGAYELRTSLYDSKAGVPSWFVT